MSKTKKPGRPSSTDKLPPGVREINGRYYWRPPNKAEEEARRAAGLPLSVALGDDLNAARRRWPSLLAEAQEEVLQAPGTLAEILVRFRDEVLDGLKRTNRGLVPRYAPRTKGDYLYTINRTLLPAFGAREYAFCEQDIGRARARYLTTADLQRWINQQEAVAEANRGLAVLSAVFKEAKRWSLTLYNPCQGVARIPCEPRTRDVDPWEIQVLLTAAEARIGRAGPVLPLQRRGEPNRMVRCGCGCGTELALYDSQGRPRAFIHGHVNSRHNNGWNMGLMIRFADLTGASAQDCRALRREHITARGVAITRGKTGNARVVAWSDELRWVIDQALAMGPEVRGAVFCNRKGQPYSEKAFEMLWKRTLARARRLAKDAGLPNSPLGGKRPLDNLHFHDIRKKSGNDAKEQGRPMHEHLGNEPATARAHYDTTRPTLVKPTR